MFGNRVGEVAGEEVHARPCAADVVTRAKLLGLLKLHQRVVEEAISNVCRGGSDVIGPPILNRGDERQVRPAAAATRAAGILSSANGTAEGHDSLFTTDCTDGTDKSKSLIGAIRVIRGWISFG